MKNTRKGDSFQERNLKIRKIYQMEIKRKKKYLICYKYKKLRHIQYDCTLYKSEAKKMKKKTMVAIWSDSEDDFTEKENERKWQTCAS